MSDERAQEDGAVEPPGSDAPIIDEAVLQRRRRARLMIGVASVLIGAGYIAMAQDFSWGELARPGPAMFPTLIGVGVILTGFGMIINALLGRNLEEGEVRDLTANRRLAAMIGLLLAFVVGLYTVGFTLPSMVATYVFLHLTGSPWGTFGRIAYSVLLVSIAELMFSWMFGVTFPGGWFGFVV